MPRLWPRIGRGLALKIHTVLTALLLLAACDDPMQSVERLGEVTLADGAAVASVMPGAADTAGAPLVLGQLLAGAAGDAVATGSPRTATGPDALQVGLGTLLPYGQIATVCGQPETALGARIAVGSGYAAYDSAPTSTALRPHYLTGFPDGCARIFSAALVLFGDIGTHEMIRYMPSNAHREYSAADAAYEQVKASFCGVPSGHPCGRNLDRLDAHTTFVTIYQTFGNADAWGEIFLSDGRVLAIDVRGG